MDGEKEIFKNLFEIDVNSKVEKKKTGGAELSYLSWAWAWAEVKKCYPAANYIIEKFGEKDLPYVFDEKAGYMVFTKVQIDSIIHEMWLPVMDGANKAMKAEPYEYTTKYGKKTVEAATMFDINKTIMRCLTKNLAMHGLGLYIYAGEDLPEGEPTEIAHKSKKETPKEPPKETPTTTDKISEAQAKRLFAITGKSNIGMAKDVMSKYGYTSSKDILKKDYENICAEVEAAIKG